MGGDYKKRIHARQKAVRIEDAGSFFWVKYQMRMKNVYIP